MDRVSVDLDEVPETLLWTLYHRAVEARRRNPVLDDPVAVELVERIDYPFKERFGAGELGQWQALRAKCFDDQVKAFLERHPEGTVVALGEGLETQFWRLDNGSVTWVSVDVPEAIAVRRRLLPGSDRQLLRAESALDGGWMKAVDSEKPVLVTAQGLLMYFEPEDVHRLLASCAEWLRGGAMVFDAVPAWLAARSQEGKMKTPTGYRPPPWKWGIDGAEEGRLKGLSPSIAQLRRLRIPRGRGLAHGLLLPLADITPILRGALLSVLRMSTSRGPAV